MPYRCAQGITFMVKCLAKWGVWTVICLPSEQESLQNSSVNNQVNFNCIYMSANSV